MQDNKNIANIDEQFTNSAWEKMQGILDKEMPVTPVRRRRWGWLWLLLFLGIMVGGTYYNFAVKNTTPPNGIPDAAIANEVENTNEIDKFEKKNDAVEHSKEKKAEKITNTSKSTIISEIPAKEKTTNSPKIISKTILEKNITQNNLHIKKENNFIDKNNTKQDIFFVENKVENSNIEKITGTSEVPVISEKESTKSIEPSIITSTKIPTQNSSAYTKRIATLSPKITTKNNAILEISPDFDPIPKVRKFSHTYSIFAGVRSDAFSGFGGVNAGFLAHYRFTPKVSLETGLMYAYTRKNIRANIDHTNAVNQLYPNNTIPYISDIEDIHNYNYFRLPLLLTYRPHNKVQLAIGANIGYRFDNIVRTSNADQEVNTYSPDFSDSGEATYNSEVDIYVSNSGEFNDLERISVPYSLTVYRMDIATQAGVRYYPSPRLGIDLSYQYGLLNMTKNITVNRNSGIQFALVYQLHR